MKDKTNIFRYFFLVSGLISAYFLTGCEKVINLDLKVAPPVMVIYGAVSDSAGPYVVTLSNSGSYFNPPVASPVTGASVIISDNMGTVDTLKEFPAGTYHTSKLQGVPGRTYTLNVVSGNQLYTATSTMHSHVNIDSMIVVKAQLSGFGFGRKVNSVYDLYCYFNDPLEKNYYRLRTFINDSTNVFNIRLYNDQYTNGEETELSAGRINAGDTCRIELLSLDQQTYEYYFTLNDLLHQNPIFGGTPANPVNNISNGAQGDFAAWAISYKNIVITDLLMKKVK
jgi:hypothetical protein